ncbi:glycosyltransferase family 2 protein [Salinibacter altiplanensis]|uniref:glycosyltransferase family 2 protein n=1 Tax=Salinibacter altiplanensis TaxID=1803181 RepID=UPI00131A52D3|nr:glycosyltransferase [Salinibacter altiplanensis]
MAEDRAPSEAIVICTRNRPGELRRTLMSIAEHPPSQDAVLVVVDASDPQARARNRQTVDPPRPSIPCAYWPYGDTPSSSRQRNYALERLPESIEIVHFLDDDVTVHADYFEALSAVLRTESDVGGVGGIVLEPSTDAPSARSERLQSLFFLSCAEDGHVLPSGSATSAQQSIPNDTSSRRNTEWLNGCSSYRRSLLNRHRFDEALTGSSMLEDLDLSYRIHRRARLVVEPEARLTHRRSARNRPDAEQYNRVLAVHRRWFVEKHFDGVAPRLAYWWSLVGRLLAITASSAPHRTAARRGLLRGLRTVLTRSHPLLSDCPPHTGSASGPS